MIWNASSFKLLLVGGAPDDGVKAVNSVSGFNEWIRIYIVDEKEIWAEINYNVKETISDWTEGNYSNSHKIFDLEDSNMYS